MTIDLSQAQTWDVSSIASLDAEENKYRHRGTTVILYRLDDRSTEFRRRLTGQFGVGGDLNHDTEVATCDQEPDRSLGAR